MEFHDYFEKEIKLFCKGLGKKLKYIEEYLLVPGKQFRPHLYLDFIKNYRLIKKSDYKIAVALEFIHLFFLIHDDLMDGDELRRDYKTIHFYYRDFFGELKANGVSIIVGDLLFCRALEIINENCINSNSKKITFEVITKTAHGQLNEYLITPRKIKTVNINQLLQFYKQKTALYSIYLPLVLGYFECGHKLDYELKIIEDLSAHLGIAFQLRDDLIEFIQEKKRNKKNLSGDILRGKITPLLLKVLKHTDLENKKIYFQEWEKGTLSEENHNKILNSGKKHKIKSYTKGLISEHLQKAYKLSKKINIENLPSLNRLYELMGFKKN